MKTNSRLLKISISAVLLFTSFLSTSDSFSQTKLDTTLDSFVSVAIDETIVTSTTSTREASLETNFNFVSWFMGTKQSVKENTTKESSTKKLLINSGVAPNRILMKTFLKKAQNQTSSVA